MSSLTSRSRDYMDYTCGDLESIMDQAVKNIKADITNPFRNALVNAVQDLETAEEELKISEEALKECVAISDDLKSQISDLEEQVLTLTSDLKQVESENSELRYLLEIAQAELARMQERNLT